MLIVYKIAACTSSKWLDPLAIIDFFDTHHYSTQQLICPRALVGTRYRGTYIVLYVYYIYSFFSTHSLNLPRRISVVRRSYILLLLRAPRCVVFFIGAWSLDSLARWMGNRLSVGHRRFILFSRWFRLRFCRSPLGHYGWEFSWTWGAAI